MAAAAPTYSQLAGVLAGFVFTAIILLVGSQSRTATDIRTLALFLSAFVVLGLASYCYGLASGDILPEACGRRETVSTVASGLLGLGAVSISSGISWLATGYSQRSGVPRRELTGGALAFTGLVQSVARATAQGTSMLVAALLGVTISSFVSISSSAIPLLLAIDLGPVLLVTGAILWRRITERTAVTDPLDRTHLAFYRLATVGSVAYTMIGTAFAGVIARLPLSDWRPVPPWAIWATPALALVVPVVILMLLIFTIPPRLAPR